MNKITSVLALSVFLWSNVALSSLFKAEEFTLNNGLRCVIVENHKAPLIKQMLWYKVGSVDEQAGKGGSAHLLEHLMFRGTKFAKDGEFNRIMEKNGVSDNAFTSHDVTAYHQFADMSKLEVLLALEADRMENLSFDEKAFEAERKIVYQERMQVVENNPASPFNERFDLILWGDNPYGRPVTGLPREIMALEYADIMNFYKKFYTPSNAVLLLSGDITAKEARPLIEKYFGEISSHQVEHIKHDTDMHEFHETLEMTLPNISTIKISERYLLPKHDELKRKVYAFLVLEEYLGGGATSALYKDLVLKQKIALSVGASYHFVSRGEGVFSLGMVPDSAKEFNREEMLSLLHNAADEAIESLSEKKLAQIKRKMLADLVFVNDNPQTAAEWIGAMLTVGFTLDEVQKYENNIKAVTLQDVKEAYTKLKKSPRVCGVLYPEDKGDMK